MKKIFVLTGEPSGDKLAAKVIKSLKKINPNIEYLCVGGENLKSLGLKSIYSLNEITYLGFTKVFLNLFSLNLIFLSDLSFKEVIKALPFHSLNSCPLYIIIAPAAIEGTQYLIALVYPGFHLGPISVPE